MYNPAYLDSFVENNPSKESFITNFNRICEDNENPKAVIQDYVEKIKLIPNYQSLNIQMLWLAFFAISLANESSKSEITKDSSTLRSILNNELVVSKIYKLIGSQGESMGEAQLLNEQRHIQTEIYSYIRLIINTL